LSEARYVLNWRYWSEKISGPADVSQLAGHKTVRVDSGRGVELWGVYEIFNNQGISSDKCSPVLYFSRY